jgi:threonyl-tRNA synthetase
MNLPERFDLTYVDSNGEKVRPIMLHRVIFGSVERFIGILIEHYAGVFPLWLAPVQIAILPVKNEFHLEYSKELTSKLQKLGFRVELNDKDEKLSYRMREVQVKKIPITLIIGDNEIGSDNISYRKFGSQETFTVPYQEFVDKLNNAITNKDSNI